VLNSVDLVTVDAAPWTYWWELELGQHVILARAEMPDGTTQMSEAVLFSVVEYEEPGTRTVQAGP
jgi:hypothetical protein